MIITSCVLCIHEQGIFIESKAVKKSTYHLHATLPKYKKHHELKIENPRPVIDSDLTG